MLKWFSFYKIWIILNLNTVDEPKSKVEKEFSYKFNDEFQESARNNDLQEKATFNPGKKSLFLNFYFLVYSFQNRLKILWS